MNRITEDIKYKLKTIATPAMKLCSNRLLSLDGTNAIFSVFVSWKIRKEIYKENNVEVKTEKYEEQNGLQRHKK